MVALLLTANWAAAAQEASEGVHAAPPQAEDLAARAYVTGLLREAGLTVRVDPAGNLFARREGTENLPVLLFGSHIDSVPNGGNFDGQVGSMGALEVMRALHDLGGRGVVYHEVFGEVEDYPNARILVARPRFDSRATRTIAKCQEVW